MQTVENAGILGKSEQCANTALTLNDLTGGHQLPDQDSNTRLIPLSRGQFAIVDAVTWARRQKRWRACAMTRGQNFHLGYFIDKESARAAVEKFRRLHHGEFYAQR